MVAIIMTLLVCVTVLLITLIVDKGLTDRARIRAVAQRETPAGRLIDGLFGGHRNEEGA